MFGTILLVLGGLSMAALLVFWLFGERWRPMRRSTWQWIRAGGLGRLLNLETLHGYLYLRWQDQYINFQINQLGPVSSPGMRKWWSSRYHSKVLTQEQAERIVLIEESIPLQDLEQIIPYPTARDIVIQAPPEIIVYECGCRRARPNPCQPTDVCLWIGQPFVDFILEHNPHSSRRVTREEALDLLRAEHERGHIHAAWFKDAVLGRFYAICNCCKCCCGGIETMVKHGNRMMAPSGYVSQIDVERCAACGTCVDVCPFGALSLDGAHAEREWEKCMGCGVCIDQCPNQAISLVRDEQKGVPLDMRLVAHLEKTGS